MEDRRIGTKSTRTNIIRTLQNREYVSGNPLRITDLGFTLAETLQEQVSKITTSKMTRDLEDDLELIQKEERTEEQVIAKSIQFLRPILNVFKIKEKTIGTSLSSTLKTEPLAKEILGSCPNCKTGQIHVIRNPKTGKRFAGCNNYDKGCLNSYPLPQKGVVKSTGKKCKTCNTPIIQVHPNRGKPWETCIDLDCKSRRTGSR
jgi:DNA topoisomerase-1